VWDKRRPCDKVRVSVAVTLGNFFFESVFLNLYKATFLCLSLVYMVVYNTWQYRDGCNLVNQVICRL
jgi:hypothetical protein